MDSKKTGELLAKLRKEKGLTQRELSSILEVSPKTISKWETGCGLPDISLLKKISEIFGITIEELLEGNLKINEEIKIVNYNVLNVEFSKDVQIKVLNKIYLKIDNNIYLCDFNFEVINTIIYINI